MKFDEMSPELQEKAEACETVEELAALAEAEGIELSDEDLDGIAGGIKNKRILTRHRRLYKKPVHQPQPAAQPQISPDTLPTVDPSADGAANK